MTTFHLCRELDNRNANRDAASKSLAVDRSGRSIDWKILLFAHAQVDTGNGDAKMPRSVTRNFATLFENARIIKGILATWLILTLASHSRFLYSLFSHYNLLPFLQYSVSEKKFCTYAYRQQVKI